MPVWMKKLFIDILPKILMIERPMEIKIQYHGNGLIKEINHKGNIFEEKFLIEKFVSEPQKQYKKKFPKNIITALNGLQYISKQMEKENNEQKVLFKLD